jgi:hypothetical protein
MSNSIFKPEEWHLIASHQINRRESFRVDCTCHRGRMVARFGRWKPDAEGNDRLAASPVMFDSNRLPEIISLFSEAQAVLSEVVK